MAYTDINKRRESCRKYYRENRQSVLDRHKKWLSDLRERVIIKLGGRCSNLDCRHLNLDGTLGCLDFRLLHIDHVNGGGTKEAKHLKNNNAALLNKVLSSKSGYQLLCASCNWLKRYLNNECKPDSTLVSDSY